MIAAAQDAPPRDALTTIFVDAWPIDALVMLAAAAWLAAQGYQDTKKPKTKTKTKKGQKTK